MFKGADVQFDIVTVCPSAKLFLMKFNSYYAAMGRQPAPDYIKIIFSVDIEGDGILVVPDENKKIMVVMQ